MTRWTGKHLAAILVILFLAVAVYSRVTVAAAAPPQQLLIASFCWHEDGSDWICTDTNATAQPMASYPGAPVSSVEIVVSYRNGQTARARMGPKTDAVFLSTRALEDFLLTHYKATSVRGAPGYMPASAGKAQRVQAYIQAHESVRPR